MGDIDGLGQMPVHHGFPLCRMAQEGRHRRMSSLMHTLQDRGDHINDEIVMCGILS